MILYQYMDLKFLSSCFENGIYASRLERVNDPYEGLGIDYPSQYRICCMTRSPLKMLMWAYYVNHHGCCVGFEVENYFQPVKYIDTLQPHEEMDVTEVIASLYTKGKEWIHEEEYRAVYYEPDANEKLWLKNNDEVYFKAKVVSVTFGLTAESNPEYMKTLEFLRDLGRSDIEYAKCKLKKGQYQLYKDKQFDLLLEIEKWVTKFDKHRDRLDEASEKKLDDYLKEHTLTIEELDAILDATDNNDAYREIDNDAGGKTAIIGSIGSHILQIKRKVEATILKKPKELSSYERKMLAIEPWHKFKCNNVILRDENIENPDFGNGLVKREPFDFCEDYGLLVGNPECSKEIQVKLRNGDVITTDTYIVDEVPFRNIVEFDEHGSRNNPYPTFYCKFTKGHPFARKLYVDKGNAMVYDESQIQS